MRSANQPGFCAPAASLNHPASGRALFRAIAPALLLLALSTAGCTGAGAAFDALALESGLGPVVLVPGNNQYETSVGLHASSVPLTVPVGLDGELVLGLRIYIFTSQLIPGAESVSSAGFVWGEYIRDWWFVCAGLGYADASGSGLGEGFASSVTAGLTSPREGGVSVTAEAGWLLCEPEPLRGPVLMAGVTFLY